MKNFFMKHKEKIKLISYCFLLSFIVLMITSKCSFLYPFNDWVDANAFFTVGKGMAHGVIPYKDLFEQKGPLLFFIYMIGYLISNTTFHGVFLLEVLFWTFTLYYAFKTITLFLSKKSGYIILPIFMVLLTTCKAFVHGGSAEEFSMPFLIVGLYYFLEHFKTKEISYPKLTIAGFCAGCILLIKYTLLGFYFGFMACIFFDLFFQKKYKKAFISCIWFLVGMFSPVAIALVYCGLTNSIKEFINVYFVANITAYTVKTANIFTRIFRLVKGYLGTTFRNGIHNFILIIGFLYFTFKLNIRKEGKKYLIAVYLLSIIGLFFGLKFYNYYLYPMYIFVLVSLIVLFSYLERFYLDFDKKNFYWLIGIICFACLEASYLGANYRSFMKRSKEDLFQFEYADIIMQDENATLTNMGHLDCGLYTVTGIIPKTYFFHKNNLSYERFPELEDSFEEYIKNKETDYIIYFTYKTLKEVRELEPLLFENYEMIEFRYQTYEYKPYYALLFKVKK